MKKILAVLMAVLMLAVCLPAGAADRSETRDVDPVGRSLADMNAPYITAGGAPSTTQFINADTFAAHTLTVINAWDSQCGPCRAEMPYFQQLYDQYGDDGEVLIVGSCDTMIGGTMLSDYNYLVANHYTYPNVIPDSVLHNLVWLNGFLPQTFIVNSEGTVIDFIAGGTDYQGLTAKIGRWLGYYSNNYYDVTFVNGVTNETIEVQSVHAGYTPTYPTPPVVPGYAFSYWSPATPPVVLGPTTIVANYNIRSFRVRFYDSITGTKLNTQYVQYQGSATAPEAPEHEGYTFVGWDKDFSCIVENTDVYTVYTSGTGTPGDADGNGVVNSADALLIMRYAMGNHDLISDANLLLCDADGNGVVNSADALLLMRISMGL